MNKYLYTGFDMDAYGSNIYAISFGDRLIGKVRESLNKQLFILL